MSMFCFTLSSRTYTTELPGITMIRVDIFAINQAEAEKILRDKFNLDAEWDVDYVEES